MKVLTLTQPWASLVAIGAKHIETRSWSTSYRGPLAIHAAAGLGPVGGMAGLIAQYSFAPFWNVLLPAGYPPEKMPRGAIIAVCRLAGCVSTPTTHPQIETGWTDDKTGEQWMLTEQERAFGDYSPGRFAWLLADIRGLPTPIPAKGALGLWEWDGSPASPQASQEAPGRTER